MSEKKNEDTKVNLAEEVTSLFEGADVTDEMREKLSTILEATVNEKVSEYKAQLDEEAEKQLDEAKTEFTTSLEETVNKYLDYVVTEWMEENKLAVESGVRVEIAENFLMGIKGLFEQNYIDVPEGKEDVLTTTQAKIDKLESSLHEQIEKVADLKAQVETHQTEKVIAEAAEGLTDTQKEKLATLSEGVEFVDVETFTKKVKTIRESFFKDDDKEDVKPEGDDKDSLNEDTDPMSRYLKALS